MWYYAYSTLENMPYLISAEEARAQVGMTVSCVQFFGLRDYTDHCAISFDPSTLIPGGPAILVFMKRVRPGTYIVVLKRFEEILSIIRNIYVVVVEDGVVVFSEESLNLYSYASEMFQIGMNFIDSNPRYQEATK